MGTHIEPGRENLEALRAQACDGPVVMLNLLRFNTDGDETWDRVILVSYPDKSAFLDMIESADYQTIAHHRNEALLDSRLYLTIPDPQ